MRNILSRKYGIKAKEERAYEEQLKYLLLGNMCVYNEKFYENISIATTGTNLMFQIINH